MGNSNQVRLSLSRTTLSTMYSNNRRRRSQAHLKAKWKHWAPRVKSGLYQARSPRCPCLIMRHSNSFRQLLRNLKKWVLMEMRTSNLNMEALVVPIQSKSKSKSALSQWDQVSFQPTLLPSKTSHRGSRVRANVSSMLLSWRMALCKPILKERVTKLKSSFQKVLTHVSR